MELNPMKKINRKRPLGSKTISIRTPAHRFIVAVGEREGLCNYEVIEKMAKHYAVSFCPDLLKCLTNI